MAGKSETKQRALSKIVAKQRKKIRLSLLFIMKKPNYAIHLLFYDIHIYYLLYTHATWFLQITIANWKIASVVSNISNIKT